MNKQEMLNKAREIKKGCRKTIVGNNEFGKLNCGDNRGHFDMDEGDWIQDGFWFCSKCKKQLKKIKDVWKDGCGKEYIDLKDGFRKDCCEKDGFCPTCEKQNKEFKEICLEVLE